MQKQHNQEHITAIVLAITLVCCLTAVWLRLLMGFFPNMDYLKYLYWFYNHSHTLILGYSIPLPKDFIIALGLDAVVALLLLAFMARFNFLPRINKNQAFFATRRDLRSFKAPTPSVSDKDGMVLGVFNTGLIPHSLFVKLARSRFKLLSNMGKAILKTNDWVFLRFLVGFKVLKTKAPLSLMCVAPAGTGKTAGVVLPSILCCDEDNLVVNDPKGEICQLTRDYRENLAGEEVKYDEQGNRVYNYSYVLAWKEDKSSKWNPSRWNPFNYKFFAEFKDSAKFFVMVNETATRAANILVQSSGSDPFWAQSAQEMFAVVAQYLIIYKYSQNSETNISEIKDCCTSLNVADDDEEQEDENAAIKQKVNGYCEFLQQILNKMYEEDTYSQDFKQTADTSINKIITGLKSLSVLPVKTRESIVQTLKSGMAIFDNPLVVANTSSNDVDYNLIRSGKNSKPITIYMVVPASEQKSYGVLNGLFVEFMYQYLVSSGEPAKTDKSIRVILDEVAFFPPISAISDAPAITRSFRISWMFICQDIEQFRTNWGEKGLQNMLTNSAFKVVLSQNNEKAAAEFARIIGNTEKLTKKGKEREKTIERNQLITPTQIMSLVNEQIVIVQTKANRPIKCDQAFWFCYPQFFNKMLAPKTLASKKL